jgi:hypothetical protein
VGTAFAEYLAASGVDLVVKDDNGDEDDAVDCGDGDGDAVDDGDAVTNGGDGDDGDVAGDDDVDGEVTEWIKTRGGAAGPCVGSVAGTVSTPAAAASDSMSETGWARFRNHVRRGRR